MPYIGHNLDQVIRAKQDAYKFVATAGQTVFTGADANTNSLDFAPTDFISVFLNGIRLIEGDDYTKGTDTITLLSGANLSDEVMIVTLTQNIIPDHYTKAEADALLASGLANKVTQADIDASIAGDNINDDGNALLNALIFGG